MQTKPTNRLLFIPFMDENEHEGRKIEINAPKR